MPSVSDSDFVMKASVGNTIEVEEAKLAVQAVAKAKDAEDVVVKNLKAAFATP